MSIYNLDYIFKPKSIAVLDVCPGDSSPSEVLFRNLIWRGYSGKVYPVSEIPVSICGIEAYPSLSSIPWQIDLAILAGPPERYLYQLESCVKKGVKGVILLGRDFRARVSEPDELLVKIYRYVERYKMRILGPNTLGFIIPPRKLNASLIPDILASGNLAFISDSATLASAVLDWAVKKKVGISMFVSLGEKVDIDLADLIDYLSLDPYTRALIIYLERLKNSRKFIGAARAFSRTKPIMVVKHGRFVSLNGQYFTEVGSLLNEDSVYKAAFRRAGVIQVDEVLELFYVAESLSKQPRPKGQRVAIVSNAGGPALLAIDTLLKLGGKLANFSEHTKKALTEFLPQERAKNPIDLLSDASPLHYRRAISLCLKDPEIDGVIVIYTPEIGISSEEIAWAIVRAAQEVRDKPVLACFMGEDRVNLGRHVLSEQNIPHFLTPVEAVKSFFYMYSYDHLLRLLFETPGSILEDFEPDQDKVQKVIQEAASKERLLLSKEEAIQVLETYGIKSSPISADPEKVFYLILGMAKDPVFGAVIIFGLGGTLTHAIKDFALGLPPLNQTLARRLMEQTKIYRYLKERNYPIFLLEELLVRFSHFIIDFPQIREIEINPLLFSFNGYAISNVKIFLEEYAFLPKKTPLAFFCPSHLAICPYPSHFIFEACLKDGTTVKVRPIKPEDEPLMAEFFYSLSEETIRFRFMQQKKTITHEELVRYCQIDYDRELALVALIKKDEKRKIIGVVRLIKYPDEENAEMAIVVADAWQGRGLGWLLFNQMIYISKQLGLKRIWMSILQENTKMIRFAKRCGFQLKEREEDILKMVLEL